MDFFKKPSIPKKKKEKKKKDKSSEKKLNKRKRRDSNELSGEQSGEENQTRRSSRKTRKVERFGQVKRVSDKGKSKAKKKVIAPCTLDPGDISEELKEAARKYALHRQNSKGRFEWKKDLPEVSKEDRVLVRRYSKKNLLPEIPMIDYEDRNGNAIKCPIFPEEFVIAEVYLPKNLYDDTDNEQFKWLDQYVVENLSDEIPDFVPKTRMSGGKKYTWHHHHEEGKMQLVENGMHSMTPHSGGREIWAAERTTPFDNL